MGHTLYALRNERDQYWRVFYHLPGQWDPEVINAKFYGDLGNARRARARMTPDVDIVAFELSDKGKVVQ